MTTAFDDLAAQAGIRQMPDGRYFLPFKNTTSYQGYRQSANPDGSLSVVNRDENGMPVFAYPGAEQPNMTTYSSPEDFYKQLDPSGVGLIGDGRQDAIGLNTTGMTREQLDAMLGTYGGDYGYFFNPDQLAGAHPATTGGSRPNENGLWNAVSLLAGPLLSTYGTFGADAGAAGSSAFGDTANVPVAAGSPAGAAPVAADNTISGSNYDTTLPGGAGNDTLNTTTNTPPPTPNATPSAGLTAKDLIPAAALLGGAYLQSDAAKKAAAQQAAATGAAIGEQGRQFDTIRADQAPYREAGAGGLLRLSDLLGTSPNTGAPGYGDLSRKFSVADFWNDPVTQLSYQTGLDLGTKALRNAAPLTTGLDSGAGLKELTKFGSDYTGLKAGESYGRFENDKTNQFGRLAALAGIGQASNAVNANAGMTTGTNIAQLLSGQGNANAAATIGQANAYGAPLTSVANWWQQNQILNNPNFNRGYSYPGTGGGAYPTRSAPAYYYGGE